jgi:hypothetical protein
MTWDTGTQLCDEKSYFAFELIIFWEFGIKMYANGDSIGMAAKVDGLERGPVPLGPQARAAPTTADG